MYCRVGNLRGWPAKRKILNQIINGRGPIVVGVVDTCNNNLGHLAAAMSLFKQMGHINLYCQENTVIPHQ